MSNVAAKRLVKLPENIEWTNRTTIIWSYIIDGVNGSVNVVHQYIDHENKISYFSLASKMDDFEIIAAIKGVFDFDTSQTKTQGLLFNIDAFGSGWKLGMRVANKFFSSVSKNEGYLFLGECNLIEAKKASLIGNAKKEISVRSRHRRLTEMMNELGYWDDEKLFDEWLDTLDSASIENVKMNGFVADEFIREIMLGKGYAKPW